MDKIRFIGIREISFDNIVSKDTQVGRIAVLYDLLYKEVWMNADGTLVNLTRRIPRVDDILAGRHLAAESKAVISMTREQFSNYLQALATGQAGTLT